MTRAEELRQYLIERNVGLDSLEANSIGEGIEWADAHPSDETIMLILNCIGYEEKSWIEFVRKELEKRKEK